MLQPVLNHFSFQVRSAVTGLLCHNFCVFFYPHKCDVNNPVPFFLGLEWKNETVEIIFMHDLTAVNPTTV